MISDAQALSLVAAVIPDSELVHVARSLYEERNVLYEACRSIAIWDMTHSQALTVDRAVTMLREALEAIDERP